MKATRILFGCLLAGMAQGQEVKDTSFAAPNGERVQRLEIVVPASVRECWDLVSTAEGWESWMSPHVEMELRTGGKFYSNYKLGAKVGDPGTIYNTVLAYVPLQMLTLKIGLTETFPKEAREAGTLFAVLTLEELGPKQTKLSETMVGWKDGPGWDWTYNFFLKGNRHSFEGMYKRLVSGPVNWQAQQPQK
ncbi:MAG: SRPBCC domain-containing protein [Acidobacteria bacterium]|nr:SRPBCC domain-containing protein [Acidobacteriota bacterium]